RRSSDLNGYSYPAQPAIGYCAYATVRGHAGRRADVPARQAAGARARRRRLFALADFLLQRLGHFEVFLQRRQVLGGERLDIGILGIGRCILEQLDRILVRRDADLVGIHFVEAVIGHAQCLELGLLHQRRLGRRRIALLLRQGRQFLAHLGVVLDHLFGERLHIGAGGFFLRHLAALDLGVARLGGVFQEILVIAIELLRRSLCRGRRGSRRLGQAGGGDHQRSRG